MSDQERKDYEELREALKKALKLTEDEFINFSPSGNDEDFNFLVRKAKTKKRSSTESTNYSTKSRG